ncbi:DUF2683 family protein [Pararhodonellum marinum]|uniref:DUF2683 family protein n=1 Tax=Pararhodonellum marinum TaxID=2755358 RepID=UPI001890AF32|nr:DUF2683 family protein [Pararhodonellum marinum]
MNNTIIIHTENKEQENALKAFAKALKMKFEVVKEKPYDPEFVAKIEKSQQEFEDGNFTGIEKKDLKSFLGIE